MKEPNVQKSVLCCLLVLCALTALGQVAPYSMLKNCPEGCRPIDYVTSCGSSDAVKYCNMAENGDVVLICTDDTHYYLSIDGCGYGNGTRASPSTTAAPGSPFSASWIADRVAETCRIFQRLVVSPIEKVHTTPLLIIFAVSAGYFAIIGLVLLRVTLALFGLFTGAAVGLVLTVFAEYDSTTAVYVISCFVGIVTALTCSLGLREGSPFAGMGLGICVSTVVMFTLFTISGNDAAAHAAYPMWIVLSSAVFCGLLGAWAPHVTAVLCAVAFSCLFAFVAPLTGETVRHALTHNHGEDCLIQVVVVGTVALAFQSFWVHRERRRERQRRIAGLLRDEERDWREPPGGALQLNSPIARHYGSVRDAYL